MLHAGLILIEYKERKEKKKHPNWVFGSDFLFLEILMMALRPLKVWKKKKLEREEKCRKIILERKRNLEKKYYQLSLLLNINVMNYINLEHLINH